MKLVSIDCDSSTNAVVYGVLSDTGVRAYTASSTDRNGIRRIECELALEALLLVAQATNADAVKTLSRATWDVVDGKDVEFPIDL